MNNTILPMPFWLLLLLVALLPLAGCASVKKDGRDEVCFFQYLGRTESGLSVAATHCMTPEAFSESQK